MATETETKTNALTTRQVAEALGTDPRTLRKFLRSQERGVGTGSRYEFKQGDLADLKKGFAAWSTKETAKKKARDERKAKAGKSAPDEAAEGISPDEMRAALSGNTVKELQVTAKGLDIAGYSAMKKAQLIDAIITAQTA